MMVTREKNCVVIATIIRKKDVVFLAALINLISLVHDWHRQTNKKLLTVNKYNTYKKYSQKFLNVFIVTKLTSVLLKNCKQCLM